LFALSALAAPSSVSSTSLHNMLQIASVLAVAGLGQMLVIQQGGVDLSVAGGMSMTVVLVTHIPDGDNAKLVPAILLAIVFALGAGLLNGFLVGVLRLNPIIATLGTNALLYGANLAISGGRPRVRGDRGQPPSRPRGRPARTHPSGLGVRLRAAALLPGRRHARRDHRPAQRLRGRQLPARLGGRRGARRHVAARRPG